MTKLQRYIILVLSLVLLGIVVYPVRATFEEDYQGYLKTYDAYRSFHGQYVTTRNQYLQFGTLASKNEALNAVKNFLSARDDVLISHISLLRVRNVDSFYNGQMDEQFKFIQDHKVKVPALGSLDDAVAAADEIEERHIRMQNLSRKIVATVIVSKLETLKLRLLLLETEAGTLIGTLRNNGKDVATLERWLIDARSKRLIAEDKINQIRAKISEFEASDVPEVNELYNNLQSQLYEVNQYIREGISFMNELAEGMKYGNY